MAQRGMNQRRLAEASGVAAPHISQLLTGKIQTPGVVALQRIATALGVDPDYLLGVEEATNKGDSPFVKVPLLASIDDVGVNNDTQAFDVVNIPLSADVDYGRLAAVPVPDDSMEPELHVGDVIVLDISPYAAQESIGKTCVVRYREGTIVRTLRRSGQSGTLIYLEAQNREWERTRGPLVLPPSDFAVVGRVIGVWRTFK